MASLLKKLLALLVCAVFGVGFTAGGILAGLLPLAEITNNAWSVRSWQPVPGRMLENDRAVGDDHIRYNFRYGYEFAGQRYESARIGLAGRGFSVIGGWQEQMHERLRAAHTQRRPVTVWVDPARPHRAVLDRGIRWPAMAFHLPFALLFTLVGALAWYSFYKTAVTPAHEPDPILRMSATGVEGGIATDLLKGPALWTLAVLLCVLSWPVAPLVWMDPQPWMPRLFVTFLAVMGVCLLWIAAGSASLRASDKWR